MNETPNQATTGSVDPLAQEIVDLARKLGARAWLGFPPPEEMEKFRAEKAERDFLIMKNRVAAKERHLAELKATAREVIRRNRESQV